MKSPIVRAGAAVLAVCLALAGAGCGRHAESDPRREGGGLSVEDIPSPTADPAGYLLYAMDGTAARLRERYGGAPLAAVAEAAASSGRFDLHYGPEDGGDAAFSGSLTFDGKARTARLDGELSTGMDDLSGSLYLSPDFAGLSSEALFGDGAFYGAMPRGLYGQAAASALSELLGRAALNALRPVDEVLDALDEAPVPDGRALREGTEARFRDLVSVMALTSQRTSVDLDGRGAEGTLITGDLDGGALGDLTALWREAVEASPALSALRKLCALAEGDGAFLSESWFLRTEEALRASGARVRVEFVTAEGLLCAVGVSILEEDGALTRLGVELLTGESVTGFLTSGGQTLTFQSDVASGPEGYRHTLSAAEAEGGSLQLTVTWREEALELRLRDGTGREAALRGTLAAGREGFTLSDIVLEEDGSARALPLRLAYTPGASVEAPGDTVDLFALTGEELEALAKQAEEAMGSR